MLACDRSSSCWTEPRKHLVRRLTRGRDAANARAEKAEARLFRWEKGRAEAGESRLSVRLSCRRRIALDGAEAQCLEHALTQAEAERDEAWQQVDSLTAARDRVALLIPVGFGAGPVEDDIERHVVRLTRERDEANARAEKAEAEKSAVTRAAEWLAERREHGPCAYCPAYHACGPDASPQDCVARLAEAPAREEETP